MAIIITNRFESSFFGNNTMLKKTNFSNNECHFSATQQCKSTYSKHSSVSHKAASTLFVGIPCLAIQAGFPPNEFNVSWWVD